jgi:iron complex transport system substrate-binding protein
VRVVSLLPTATEIVYSLGLKDSLVGVTDECDQPDGAPIAVVSRCVLPTDLTAAEIDRAVSASEHEETSLYEIDAGLLSSLRPDVILTQDLCPVCALPASQAEQAVHESSCAANVISLDPHSVDDVLSSIRMVADVLGASSTGDALVADLRTRIDRVRQAVDGAARPTVLGLEWGDPPWGAGHWVPEMIRIAGGQPVLANDGVDSQRISWDDIAAAEPDVVAFMPCSYGLAGAVEQAHDLFAHPEFVATPAVGAGRVFATDAERYFSRSGPRIVDGIELLAGLVQPQRWPAPAEDAAVQISG